MNNEIAKNIGELILAAESHGLYILSVGAAEGWFDINGKVSENIDEVLDQIDSDCPDQLQRFVHQFQKSLVDQYENIVAV
ncbi:MULTISPECIES: hypothetical protein [Halococcus]|uniref:hypothetical protein n=1 Tax=Halococcus TaxID=2249 RepID=UPI00126811AB|nr:MULTISPECIES: hypothetical protein [Halococcus]